MNYIDLPKSKIIHFGDGMFKLLAKHKNNNYNKEQLGHLVKFYGGNKILMSNVDNKLLICEKIEDADYVEI